MTVKGIALWWLACLTFCVIVWVFAIIGLVHVVGGCQAEKVEPAPTVNPTCPPTTGKEFQELKKWRSVNNEWFE